MEPSLLVWGFFAFMIVPGCVTEFCGDDPPTVRHAMFKAISYKIGTMLNCECKKGFRRISKGSLFMLCKGNSSHSSWENKCQCVSTSSGNTEKPVTPKPEEQKERKTTEMPSQTQPMDPVNLLGHCREPSPWEHEAPERIYHFVVGQTVHYQCTRGFRALRRSPAESVCKMICGKTRWTQPQLRCTSERKDSELAGDEEPQASTDAPPGSETSCPLTMTGTTGTTDFEIHTEVSTTMETFIFTTEYQMAVAGCVLLLISILLLSGLTWQRRWRTRDEGCKFPIRCRSSILVRSSPSFADKTYYLSRIFSFGSFKTQSLQTQRDEALPYKGQSLRVYLVKQRTA